MTSPAPIQGAPATTRPLHRISLLGLASMVIFRGTFFAFLGTLVACLLQSSTTTFGLYGALGGALTCLPAAASWLIGAWRFLVLTCLVAYGALTHNWAPLCVGFIIILTLAITYRFLRFGVIFGIALGAAWLILKNTPS